MGNMKSNVKKKNKISDKLKLFFGIRLENQFNKLSINIISTISSFLTLKEFNIILSVCSTTNQIFSQVSSCYQIHCQKILNVKCDIINSKNWKQLLRLLLCTPIKGIPYENAIKSIRFNIQQHPTFIEKQFNYSTFQKSILYFESKFQKIQTKEYEQIKQYSSNHFEQILKLRQGCEVHIQMPQSLMNIYNIQDYIKIYNVYLNMRFDSVNLTSFLELWDRYCGWISIMEWSTSSLINQFNQIIDETLHKYNIPKFTFRHFMTTQWIINSNKCIKILRKEFEHQLFKSRMQNTKIQLLRRYIQYLIDISTNQSNIQQYGQANFQYDPEIYVLAEIAVDMTSNQHYFIDEQILIYTFGQYIYQFIIFQNLNSKRIEQFKILISEHKEASINQQIKQYQNPDELQQINQVLGRYNPKQQIRTLIKMISRQKIEDKDNQSQNEVQESLETSEISQISTTCSSVFMSTKSNDVLLNYIQMYQKDLYNQIEHFYQLQETIIELFQDVEQQQQLYDVPELAEYKVMKYETLIERLNQIKQRQTKKGSIMQSPASMYGRTTAQEILQRVIS
ncbi:unnamed protein product [Paramecium primaurelia]|uniref:F-box domain-containing protein n=1 Tax=Paramecium primaurelia TaxID=5886 RepID=A0A8S1PU49_PARPR|nr:unnamed protein product [Paramecium primaurelia]